MGRGAPAILSPQTGEEILPRKPNYKFERMERDRAKAAKKAARQKAKAERRNQDDDTAGGDDPMADTPTQSDPKPDQD